MRRAWAAVLTRQVVLLDVDGVLNALRSPDRHEPGWRTGSAVADATSWPITWRPAAVQRLRDWHQSRMVELRWLTTWGHDANDELRLLLGLPHLAVAGTHSDMADAGRAAQAGGSHAGAAPSAPDPLSGRWWKYDVVRRLTAEQPDLPIIWVDDELRDPDTADLVAAVPGRLVLIGPDPQVGISDADLDVIGQLL